jgi:hypothetical protein
VPVLQKYPFHSLLHNHVDGLFMAILESGQDEMLLHLLVRCKLLEALSTAPEKVKPKGKQSCGRRATSPSRFFI